MRNYIVIFLLLFIIIEMKGQCYDETRTTAIKEFKSQRFNNSLAMFKAAKSCPDRPKQVDLDFWISKCNQALNPNTEQSVISFAKKMNNYEEVIGTGWSEGLLAVTKKEDAEKFDTMDMNIEYLRKYAPKIGFVNANGDLVIPCKFVDPSLCSMRTGYFFSDELANVIMCDEDGAWGWGYIGRTGKVVVPCVYVDAAPFGEGLAAVSEDYEQYYFINKKGERISSDSYFKALVFSEGLCAVQPDSTSGIGYIDKSGNMIIKPQYSNAFTFKNGVAVVFDEKTHGYESALINKSGEIISGYAFRPEYLSLVDIYSYVWKKDNAGEFDKAYIASIAYEKQSKERNNGELSTRTSWDWFIIYRLGRYYYSGQGGATQDYKKAIEYWKLVENHHSASMYMLGICYYYGYGVEQNYAESLKYFKRCADKDNDANAFYNIGLQYYNGQGVEKNCQSALNYFQKAKEFGSKNAESMIEKCKVELRKLLQ